MTTFVNGIIVSRQLGTINALINDAPYTIPKTIGFCGGGGGSSPGGFMFAQGSLYPVLWNYTWNEVGFPLVNLIKANAAILGLAAPTLIVTGYQNGLDGSSGLSGSNNNKSTPCYYGGFLAACRNVSASFYITETIAAAPGVGSTQFPFQFFKTTADSTISQAAQTFVVNYQNKWAFAVVVSNGARSQMKWFLYGPTGAFIAEVQSTVGPFPLLGGPTGIDNLRLCLPYTPGGGFGNSLNGCTNVLIDTYDTNGHLVLYFLDGNFNVIFARYLQLDNAAADAKLSAAQSTPSAINIQCTVAGWLISVNTPYNINGYNQPYSIFLVAKDGSYWAPVIIKFNGPIAVTQPAMGFANGSSVTIDPTGVLWYTHALGSDPSKAYIGNSFGTDLQIPTVPFFNNINLPPFDLPCFTPCDTPSISP